MKGNNYNYKELKPNSTMLKVGGQTMGRKALAF